MASKIESELRTSATSHGAAETRAGSDCTRLQPALASDRRSSIAGIAFGVAIEADPPREFRIPVAQAVDAPSADAGTGCRCGCFHSALRIWQDLQSRRFSPANWPFAALPGRNGCASRLVCCRGLNTGPQREAQEAECQQHCREKGKLGTIVDHDLFE